MYIRSQEAFNIVKYIPGSSDGETVELTIQRLSDKHYWDFDENEFVSAEKNGEMTFFGGETWQGQFTPPQDDTYIVFIENTSMVSDNEFVEIFYAVGEVLAYGWNPATKIKICNLSLRMLGAGRIMALDEDSEQARTLLDAYDPMLDETLVSHPWNFAVKRATLAKLSETPQWEYTYAYALPADCLRVIETEKAIEYQQEDNKLLTNESSMKIRYISRVTDPTKYSSGFVTAFAARLAAEVAFPITGDGQMAKTKFDEFTYKITQAKSFNGQEGAVRQEDESSWLTERG